MNDDPAAGQADDGVAPPPEDDETGLPQPPRDRSWILDLIWAVLDAILP